MKAQTFAPGSRVGALYNNAQRRTVANRRVSVAVRSAAAEGEMVDEMGFKLMRRGVKVAANETILTPR